MHPAARVSTNALIRTTVRNKIFFVLDFIVHYYNMFRPRSVAIFLCTFSLRMANDRGRNML
jgi:hypothetical protein